jgi:hypothetical protein
MKKCAPPLPADVKCKNVTFDYFIFKINCLDGYPRGRSTVLMLIDEPLLPREI